MMGEIASINDNENISRIDQRLKNIVEKRFDSLYKDLQIIRDNIGMVKSQYKTWSKK